MKLIFRSFMLFLCSLTSTLFSQTNLNLDNNPNLITHTHFYSFKGSDQSNKEQINQLQNELKKIEFVADVQIKFSEEKKAGYLKIVTQETPVKNEGDRVFSAAVLKNYLIHYKLNPLVYNVEAGIK